MYREINCKLYNGSVFNMQSKPNWMLLLVYKLLEVIVSSLTFVFDYLNNTLRTHLKLC